jgi:hypothetical protein
MKIQKRLNKFIIVKYSWKLGATIGIAIRRRTGWYGVRIPVGSRDFSPLQHVHTVSEAHVASYSRGTESFPEVTNHSYPSTVEVKN